MTGAGAAAEQSRGYVVFRRVELGLWCLVGDVDFQPGLTAPAERARAVQDATCGTTAAGAAYAALPRDQWHVLRYE